jgi:hypothetical protein
MCETIAADKRGEVQLQPKPQAGPHPTSWNDFCRLVLKIIAELSPCSESRLLIVAANRGLERFGDGSLGDLSKLLGQCVQELQARRLVEITGEQLVIAPPASAEDEDILDLTAELELRPPKLDEASTNRKRANPDDAWEEPRAGAPQTKAQVTDGTERPPEPTREEIIPAAAAASAEDEDILDLTAEPARSAEDEDILDLTAELELRPPKLDEASTNQKQANPDDAWEEPHTGTPQTQAQVTESMERPPEPTSKERIAAPAGSAEDEDILDLTAELELRPPKLDEASTNRKRANPDDAWEEPRAGTPQTKAQVTDGTERSPEPTSEEIIAAMRQFISDDQTS